MAETMRGVVFTGDGKVAVRDFPRPRPKGTEVLVRMRASGLCGSDMHPYRRPADYWSGYPIIRGHEPGGEVAEVGEAVTMVRPGQRVSVYHAPSCGHCEPCANGEFFRCTTIGPGYRLASLKVHGSDADYLLVDQNVCFAVPEELDFEDAAIIACAGGTAFHALSLARIRGGEFVLVSGLGPVGLCVARLAEALGATVIGADPVAYRRELALEHGARFAVDPSAGPVADEVKRITGEGAEVAVETSGNDAARVDVVAATPYHARVLYVGLGGTEKNFALGPALGERWISGSNMFTRQDYFELVRLLIRRKIHLSDLVTHRFALDRAQEAFDLFESDETGKVMFTWQ
jgi:threonine dehydrogenase-like Zn-dependent dehydrogenase